MKIKKFLFLLMVLNLFSCSKNEDFREKLQNNKEIIPPIEAIMNEPFTKDFPISKTVREVGEKPSDLYFKTKGMYYLPYDEFQKKYTLLKQELIKISESPEWANQSYEIQSIVLKVLRLQILKQDTEISKRETKFLFNLLLKYEAIDLDVLVDAYLKSVALMSSEEKVKGKEYLRKRYRLDSKEVFQNFETLKKMYESSENLTDKRQAYFSGKRLEKISQAMKYSRELIPEIVVDNFD